MNPKIPCNLIVGIQSIALKVSPGEEAYVRNAASLVNDLVRYYEQQTNSSDPAAVMAMVTWLLLSLPSLTTKVNT